MSRDDLTNNLKPGDQEDNTTQPMMTAVFRLLREVQEGQVGLNSRLDALESRLDRDFAAVDTRFAEMTEVVKSGFLQLADKIERSRLHSEADYHDLLRRIRELESKAS